jgi:hypothetical protein
MASQKERQRAYRERKKQREQGNFRTISVPIDLVPKLEGCPQVLVERYAAGDEGLRKEIEAEKERITRAMRQILLLEALKSLGLNPTTVREHRRVVRNRSKLRARTRQLECLLAQAEERARSNNLRLEVLAANRAEADEWAELSYGVNRKLIAWGSVEAEKVRESTRKHLEHVVFAVRRNMFVIRKHRWFVTAETFKAAEGTQATERVPFTHHDGGTARSTP